MSRMKAILKRGKKKDRDYPKQVNGFLEFNYRGIISDNRTEENPLIGCESSDTLYLEGEYRETPVSLILTGSYGEAISENLNKRFSNSNPSAIYLGFNTDFQKSSDLPSIVLPPEDREINSFLQGKNWYQKNEERIKSYVKKAIRNTSIAFIFLDNNPFILGLMQNVITYIKDMKTQPVLFLHLPSEVDKINEEFSILAFIYNILKKETSFNAPIVIVDEKYALKLNSNISIEEMRNMIIQREANLIADLLLGISQSSNFYHTDQSNFDRIFRESNGICQLFSLDIYDNNPDLSYLFKRHKKACSFLSTEKPTRGYVIIQSGNEGLKTEIYQNIREFYGNSDVILSILSKRANGAIIRGVYSFISTPRNLLDRYSKFDKVSVLLYDIEDQVKAVTKEKLYEEVLNAKRFELKLLEEVKK